MPTYNSVAVTASVLGALAVTAGALGAHALKSVLGDSIDAWHTAVLYQLTHSILVMVLWLAYRSLANPRFITAAKCLIAGIVCFSGSLYLLILLPHAGIQLGPIIGPITPVGGVLMIAGWVIAGRAACQSTIKRDP